MAATGSSVSLGLRYLSPRGGRLVGGLGVALAAGAPVLLAAPLLLAAPALAGALAAAWALPAAAGMPLAAAFADFELPACARLVAGFEAVAVADFEPAVVIAGSAPAVAAADFEPAVAAGFAAVAADFALAPVVAGALGRGRLALLTLSPAAAPSVPLVSAVLPLPARCFPVAPALLPAAALPAGPPRLPRPNRPPRAGACSINTRHSSSVNVFGSRSFGILAFFLPSVTYGP
jgi:hypothetical protein